MVHYSMSSLYVLAHLRHQAVWRNVIESAQLSSAKLRYPTRPCACSQSPDRTTYLPWLNICTSVVVMHLCIRMVYILLVDCLKVSTAAALGIHAGPASSHLLHRGLQWLRAGHCSCLTGQWTGCTKHITLLIHQSCKQSHTPLKCSAVAVVFVRCGVCSGRCGCRPAGSTP